MYRRILFHLLQHASSLQSSVVAIYYITIYYLSGSCRIDFLPFTDLLTFGFPSKSNKAYFASITS